MNRVPLPRVAPPFVPAHRGEIPREAAWAFAPWYFCEEISAP